MEIPEEYLWMVIVGFIIAFILSCGIGANDVANSFGTSVGSRVLTLRQACILGSIFEMLGAILIGYRVSDTIRKGIIDVEMYNNGSEKVLMAGNIATLTGSCVWLIAATIMCFPVSTTHSIVGAAIGFSLVAKGASGIKWIKIGFIVGSWFFSPILSGVVSLLTFMFINKMVLQKEKSLESGLMLLPFFYGLTAAINLFSIFYEGSNLLQFDKIPLYGVFVITCGLSLLVAIGVRVFVVPWSRRKITDECNQKIDEKNQEVENATELEQLNDNEDLPDIVFENEVPSKKIRESIKDKPEVVKLFSFLQILTAVFGSFAHGGNDVSNSIGPLVAIWMIAKEGTAMQASSTPLWILVYGGVGIVIGLWIWGRRVIKTVGDDLTKITPSSGFCIELGSALTVLIASNIGIPISTTHCKIGSVVFVGRVRSKENVDWKLFRNIIIAWVVTLPVSGAISALAMLGLQELI
ncbi:sodium-dependent phosphate transporter 1-B-like isoform X2 [Mizuhopecten yessoensis]|nr:sodium-dependent phosphate transporter 1-B-like isoform X2 [Mizuhopecten yessoensis]XP_021356165.1 sodium-dependent phosphate transporter 1-B-like isoform X2 [Mizuhopecten yessoensis]XP_021356166.1 sodium-dependent phosphate transporter 1-B-like isoform X2 [Mizuhopecten yessoensis]